MRFLTYNIWMADMAQERRFRSLLETLEELDPDVVALQEVTPHVLPYLATSAWARTRVIVPSVDAPRARYFCSLLAREPFAQVHTHPFPGSSMAREVVVGTLASGWSVATTHLESLEPSAPLRPRQLAESFAQLPPAGPAVLMGDMNHMAQLDPEPDLPPGWVDAWLAAGHDHADGLTYDGERNPFARGHAERLDRIYLRAGEGWRLRSIALVGTEEIAPGVRISDHFGLVCDVDEV